MPFATLAKNQEAMLADAGNDTKEWEFKLITAPMNNPIGCCYGCFCTCCFAYQQRDRILTALDLPYRCCGGQFCCCTTPVFEPPMRAPCMCLEALCFPFLASMVNRDLIMMNYLVKFDPCDECLLTCAVCLSWVTCVFDLLGIDYPEGLADIIDLIITAILSCSLAQQEAQLDKELQISTWRGGNHGSQEDEEIPLNQPAGPEKTTEPSAQVCWEW